MESENNIQNLQNMWPNTKKVDSKKVGNVALSQIVILHSSCKLYGLASTTFLPRSKHFVTPSKLQREKRLNVSSKYAYAYAILPNAKFESNFFIIIYTRRLRNHRSNFVWLWVISNCYVHFDLDGALGEYIRIRTYILFFNAILQSFALYYGRKVPGVPKLLLQIYYNYFTHHCLWTIAHYQIKAV